MMLIELKTFATVPVAHKRIQPVMYMEQFQEKSFMSKYAKLLIIIST